MVVREAVGQRAATAPGTGDDVFTHDGKRLGTVADMTDGHFKVHLRWWRDYWLSRELIRMREPGQVTLHISRDVVSNYKTRQPNSSRT